ncbi:hypothetical protein C8R43DRAFT_1130491 [Mycena crocata]|nr:hypothetical protein C8R43DRAFT_1130491 [Mycena crocata]
MSTCAHKSLHYGTATARMHWCMFPPQNIATPSSRSKTTKAPPLNRLLATIVPRRAVSTRRKNSECWLNLGVLKIKTKKPPNPHCNHQASIAAIVPHRAADAGKTPTWLKCKRGMWVDEVPQMCEAILPQKRAPVLEWTA